METGNGSIALFISIMGLIAIAIELAILIWQSRIGTSANRITAELEILKLINEYSEDFENIEINDLEGKTIEEKDKILEKKTKALIRILNTLDTAFELTRRKVFNAEDFYDKMGAMNFYYFGYLYLIFHKSREYASEVLHWQKFDQLIDYMRTYFRSTLYLLYQVFNQLIVPKLDPQKDFEEIYGIIVDYMSKNRDEILKKIKKLL